MRDILSDLDKAEDCPANPMKKAQAAMRPVLPKRFWKDAAIGEAAGDGAGFTILLDGRLARTPGRKPLGAGTRALAERLAEEWRDVGTHVDPDRMPLTRILNTSIDSIEATRAAVIESTAAYGGSDLLCYRSVSPAGLVAMQEAQWDPLLDWARAALGAELVLAGGVIHVAQPEPALAALTGAVAAIGEKPERLAALNVVTTLTGSLVLALALTHGAFEADTLWQAAHVDEDWNARLWGEDAEALARRVRRRKDFDAAELILRLA